MNGFGQSSQLEHICQMMANDHPEGLNALRSSVHFTGTEWAINLTPPLAPIFGTGDTTWILGDADVAAILGVRPISFQPVNLILSTGQ